MVEVINARNILVRKHRRRSLGGPIRKMEMDYNQQDQDSI